jgi:adenylosuccinate lyase
MAANEAVSGDVVFSESVLLALVDAGVAREEAYRGVQRAAFAARDGAGRFADLVATDPDVARHQDRATLAGLFDRRASLQHVGTIIDRALRAGRA